MCFVTRTSNCYGFCKIFRNIENTSTIVSEIYLQVVSLVNTHYSFYAVYFVLKLSDKKRKKCLCCFCCTWQCWAITAILAGIIISVLILVPTSLKIKEKNEEDAAAKREQENANNEENRVTGAGPNTPTIDPETAGNEFETDTGFTEQSSKTYVTSSRIDFYR